MGFTLSASDREKLQKVIKDVNALTLSKKQGRSFNQFNREYTYVKLTSNVLDGGSPTLFWYASEVGFDTAGLPVVKTNGKVWDVTTNPLLVEGEVGAVNDIVRVEPSALSDGSLIWLAIKPASGGGAEKVRLKVKATATSLNGVVFLCDIIDNAGVVLTVGVNVRQKKFTSAKFYINEIIYADAEGADYLADAYLAGIGVG
jgi:hypothetical protein